MPFLVLLFPILWILFVMALLGGGAYLVLRFVRAYERRVGSGADGDSLAERVALLERTVERMEREMEQVAEGQRFMNQLVAARVQAPPNASVAGASVAGASAPADAGREPLPAPERDTP